MIIKQSKKKIKNSNINQFNNQNNFINDNFNNKISFKNKNNVIINTIVIPN